MPLYIAKSRDLDRCYRCLTDSQSKDSATQLLTKYKSGALVTQISILNEHDGVSQCMLISGILLLVIRFFSG